MTESAIQSIQAMVAPAVLMTTGAILAGGIQTMYAAVNDRMRSMTREKLDRLTDASGALVTVGELGAASSFRLGEIDIELPKLKRRHRLLSDALLFHYAAILLVVVAMILIAIAITVPAGWAGTVALVTMLTATALLLFGIGLVAVEVRLSVDAVDYEVDRTTRLGL